MKRARILLVAGLVLATAGPGRAWDEVIPLESPDWFIQGFGSYAHRETLERVSRVEGSTLTLPAESNDVWRAGGAVTIPVVAELGVRASVQGRGLTTGAFGAESELDEMIGRGEVFWRDPTKGQVGIGYAYTDGSVEPVTFVSSTRTHSLPVFASLYMPELNGGTVDWDLGFRYDWIELRGPGGTADRWAYEVLLTSTWYLNRHVSFTGGAEYERFIGPGQSDVVEGVFSLEILVPSGVRSFGVVELLGRVGRRELKDQGEFGDESQRTWEVGARVSVHFPGVTSLVELNRAYR